MGWRNRGFVSWESRVAGCLFLLLFWGRFKVFLGAILRNKGVLINFGGVKVKGQGFRNTKRSRLLKI